MKVNRLNVTYREASPNAPAALVFRDGDDLIDVVPAGVRRARIPWLPAWLPFNSWFDDGPDAVEDVIRQWVAEYTMKVQATVMVEGEEE
jgi:hypothetical protein